MKENGMRSIEEIRSIILSLYSELGKDVDEIRYVTEEDITQYKIVRDDDAKTFIMRKDIDDFFGSSKEHAKINIMNALSNFKLHVDQEG